jgi:hypothetical protein
MTRHGLMHLQEVPEAAYIVTAEEFAGPGGRGQLLLSARAVAKLDPSGGWAVEGPEHGGKRVGISAKRGEENQGLTSSAYSQKFIGKGLIFLATGTRLLIHWSKVRILHGPP